jgi:hypothetical protein
VKKIVKIGKIYTILGSLGSQKNSAQSIITKPTPKTQLTLKKPPKTYKKHIKNNQKSSKQLQNRPFYHQNARKNTVHNLIHIVSCETRNLGRKILKRKPGDRNRQCGTWKKFNIILCKIVRFLKKNTGFLDENWVFLGKKIRKKRTKSVEIRRFLE